MKPAPGRVGRRAGGRVRGGWGTRSWAREAAGQAAARRVQHCAGRSKSCRPQRRRPGRDTGSGERGAAGRACGQLAQAAAQVAGVQGPVEHQLLVLWVHRGCPWVKTGTAAGGARRRRERHRQEEEEQASAAPQQQQPTEGAAAGGAPPAKRAYSCATRRSSSAWSADVGVGRPSSIMAGRGAQGRVVAERAAGGERRRREASGRRAAASGRSWRPPPAPAQAGGTCRRVGGGATARSGAVEFGARWRAQGAPRARWRAAGGGCHAIVLWRGAIGGGAWGRRRSRCPLRRVKPSLPAAQPLARCRPLACA